MKTWPRRIRGAIGLGLIWAAGGVGVGMLIELMADVLPGGLPMSSAVDIWPALLAIVGFLGGTAFSAVLGLLGGRHRFEELSLPRFTAWGAMAGVLLGGLMVATAGAPAGFMVITTLWSAIAAAGSLLLARKAEKRELLDPDADAPGVGRAGGEAQMQLGGTD